MSQSNTRPNFPSRVRVLIIGGGIHGVGLLHDLTSRGMKDVLLVEKGVLGCGTSSRSTKLVHGGLRYLRNPGDTNLFLTPSMSGVFTRTRPRSRKAS